MYEEAENLKKAIFMLAKTANSKDKTSQLLEELNRETTIMLEQFNDSSPEALENLELIVNQLNQKLESLDKILLSEEGPAMPDQPSTQFIETEEVTFMLDLGYNKGP